MLKAKSMLLVIVVAMTYVIAEAGEVPPPPPNPDNVISKRRDKVIPHIVGQQDLVGSFEYIAFNTRFAHILTKADPGKTALEPGTGEMMEGSYSSETAWSEPRDDATMDWWQSGPVPGKRVHAFVKGQYHIIAKGKGKPKPGGNTEPSVLEWTTMSIDLDLDADTNRDGTANLTDPQVDAVEDKDEDQSGHGALVAAGGRAPLLLRQVLPVMPKPRPDGVVTITRESATLINVVFKGTTTSIFSNPKKPTVSEDLWSKVKDAECELEIVGQNSQRGGEIVTAEYRSGTLVFTDKVRVAVVLDLDIDSDNNNGFDNPDRSQTEDEIEDDPAKPGKIVACNTKDEDDDDIPGFADGFDLDGTPGNADDRSKGTRFVPLYLEVWGGAFDISKATFIVSYNASDPTGVKVTGTAPNLVYTPASGKLRIWKKDGGSARNKSSANSKSAPGDYVVPGVYSRRQLGLTSSLFSSTYSTVLYVEGIAPSNAIGDQSIAVLVDPDGPGPGQLAPVDAVRVTVLNVNLLVDTNRDGKLSLKDEQAKDTWTKDRGAIFSTNYNRDGARTRAIGTPIPDAIDFLDDGTPSGEDFVIENADDEKDIAPLRIRSIGMKNAKVFLRVPEKEDIQSIHLYKKIKADPANRAIWGSIGDRVLGGTAEPLELEITKWVDPSSADYQGDTEGNVTFGIEGLFFRNTGTDNTFNGEIDFILELRADGKVISSDKVRMKVAPWMMISHAEPSTEAWLRDNGASNESFRLTSSASPGYVGIDNSGQMKVVGPVASGSQWLQDHVEIGHTQFPGGRKTLSCFRLPYANLADQPEWPMTLLLGQQLGAFQVGIDLGADSGDFGGNLEIMPPTGKYRLGRVVVGNTCSPRLWSFLQSQEVQVPVKVPTEWLRVGHMDEVVAFVGTQNQVVCADPKMAYAILTAMSDEEKQRGVFFATGKRPDVGQTGSSTATRLYDGPATGEIVAIEKAKLKDGETFDIGDGAATKVFEFDTDGKVVPGQGGVNIALATSASEVRDAIVAAINAAPGLAVRALADGSVRVHLHNTNIGKNGNVPITETVGDPGFIVLGMTGGKDDGKDFTTESWNYVRIFNSSGSASDAAGQTAHIALKGKGFVVVDTVWNTSSRVLPTASAPECMMNYMFSAASPGSTWFKPPKAGDKYVVAEGTRFWFAPVPGGNGTPAMFSVSELLSDTELRSLNTVDIPKQINAMRQTLQTAAGGRLTFIGVPVIYVGKRGSGFATDRSGVAFTPGLPNLHVINGKLYFPRQFGPRDAAGNDLFETKTRDLLPAGVFVDDWDLYHRLEGEVHCGITTKRQIPVPDWWLSLP